MKKVFFLFLNLIASYFLHAQDAPKIRKNFLKINMVSPIDNIFALAYERKINSEISWQVSSFGVVENYNYGCCYSESTTGFGLTGELRFYASERKDAPKGFFVAPYLTYMHFNSKNTFPLDGYIGTPPSEIGKNKIRTHTAGLGMVVGYQFFLKNRITIDGWVGPGFYLSDIKNLEDSSRYYYYNIPYFINQGGHFGARVGATVGIAF